MYVLESSAKYVSLDYDHKEQLLSLCRGLEIENIDWLLTKPPSYFETIGKMLALKIKKCKCG